MTTIFGKLTEDHNDTKKKLSSIQKADNAGRRKQIFQSLKYDLEIHTSFEEEIFYPEARSATGMDDEIDDDLQEHREAKEILEALEGMEPSSQEFEEKISELEEALEHHISDEEEKLFPVAREKMDDALASRMGQQYEDTKKDRQAAQ